MYVRKVRSTHRRRDSVANVRVRVGAYKLPKGISNVPAPADASDAADGDRVLCTCVGAHFDAILHECLTVSQIHLLGSQLITRDVDERQFTTDCLSANDHMTSHTAHTHQRSLSSNSPLLSGILPALHSQRPYLLLYNYGKNITCLSTFRPPT